MVQAGGSHAKDLFRGKNVAIGSELLRKTHHVLELRNSALHNVAGFNQDLKNEKYQRFVPDTRDALESLQERG